ncbi:hypothetical protein EDD21DRAFT_21103 [Dissophora ornata]|nr:hypothetical protein EDD21DRAFT_21103 [Dissophora ornata]
MLPNTSSSTLYQQRHTRKDSISHSIQSAVTGELRSAAPSVYELASETFPDGELGGQSTASIRDSSIDNTDPGYHEITEMVVEEEVLNDDEYAVEVQRATASLSVPSSPKGYVYARNQTSGQGQDEEEEEEDDEVYQSSVEHDEDDSDNGNSHSQGYLRSSSATKRERPSVQPLVIETKLDSPSQRRQDERDDFVDEGVFDEEEKDEQDVKVESQPHSPETIADIVLNDKEENKQSGILAQPKTSWDGSISSGYGGSVLSDKEAISHRALDLVLGQKGDVKQDMQLSPVIVPYRVNALYDINDPPLSLDQNAENTDRDEKSTNNQDTTEAATLDTLPVSSTPLPSTPSISEGEPVCPVSKKTASSGGVCPAAMFAQARANAAAEGGEESKSSSATTNTAGAQVNFNHSSPRPSLHGGDSAYANPTTGQHWRSVTEPAASSTPSSVTSAVTVATDQGRRIGQGIVSRFSALRSSLAAASSRATSLALSGGSSSSSSSTTNPNAVVVRDPVTNQSVTVICPHLASTQVLETEMVRLQTDISVLHERLDLLQESLQVKSQTRELERRSARGIIKMVLRQGLINAVLLLIVFAVLYKRKSPIAFAILAYIGQGRREGEAGWRAFMRWCADLVRTGQRNQKYVLQAGRRNGYW